MTDYLARLFYLGDRYYGSQYQPEKITVQGELIKAVSEWSGEEHSSRSVRISGRTDKGVHSLGQVVLLSTKSRLNLDILNKYLPDDIILWACIEAPPDFQPRFSALMRHYRYYLDETWENVNPKRVRSAIDQLIGTHNFELISKPDGDRSTMTTILNMAVVQTDTARYLEVFGTSFLWKFVRKAVTLLQQVGLSQLDSDSVSTILQGSKTPIPGGIAPAPPERLVLIETIVPLRFVVSRYALREVRMLLEKRVKVLRSSLETLKDSISLFSA